MKVLAVLVAGRPVRVCALVAGGLVALATVAFAATLTITTPGSFNVRGQALCTLLQQRLEIRDADWSLDLCGAWFFQKGVRTFEGEVTRSASQQTVKDDVRAALAIFDVNYPNVVFGLRAFCGDGVVDDGTLGVDLGEECDPPDADVTCDDECHSIP